MFNPKPELGPHVLERRVFQEQVLARTDLMTDGLNRPADFAELDTRVRASDARVRKVSEAVDQEVLGEVRQAASDSFGRVFDALEGLGEAHA